MRDPNFMIVGAPRSGSTYLMENLLSHPRVFMPEPPGDHSTGDIHFFDVDRQEGRLNHARGLDWYRSLFAAARPDQIAGEKTADYLSDRYACDLIHDAFGAIRIIILIRDPIERTYSHLWQARHILPAQSSFSALVADGRDIGDARIFSASFYTDAIRRYINTFGRENVCLVVLDDLFSEPGRELARICRFLRIEEDHEFPLKHTRINRGTASPSARLLLRTATQIQKAAPRLYKGVRDSRLGSLAKAFIGKRRGTRQHAPDDSEAQTLGYPPIGASDRRRLQAMFREDIRRLSKLLDRDLATLWWGEPD